MWIPKNEKFPPMDYPTAILAKDVSSGMGTFTKGSLVYIIQDEDYHSFSIADDYGHRIYNCSADCIEEYVHEGLEV